MIQAFFSHDRSEEIQIQGRSISIVLEAGAWITQKFTCTSMNAGIDLRSKEGLMLEPAVSP